MFKEVADIKTSDQLHLPVPDEFRKITENLLTKSSPKVQAIGRERDLPSSSTSRN